MSNSSFRLRGELRLKNARLVEAREAVGMNQREFAEHLGLGQGAYNGYETMRNYPGPKHREILSKYCGCTEGELFPVELKNYANGDEPRKILQIAEVEPSRLLGSVRKEVLLMPGEPVVETEFDQQETRKAIDMALFKVLTPREEKILRLYFGLNGDEPLTLEEISALIGISRGRVGQIKDRALSRLRKKRTAEILEPAALSVEGLVLWQVSYAAETLKNKRLLHR